VARHQSGNGSGKFNVVTQDLGGWVRVYLEPGPVVPADLPVYLAHALTQWFRQHPELTLGPVAPIQRDGQTVELHAWYTRHSFPDQFLPGQQPPQG
jgi:hypothetical protein